MQTGRGRIENKKPVKQTHDEQETIATPQGGTGGGLEEAQMNYTCAGEGNGTEKKQKTGRRERLKRCRAGVEGKSKLVEKAEH